MRTSYVLPSPPEILNYTWRSAKREDAEAIHQLLVDIEAVDHRDWIDTLDDRFRDFDDPDSNAGTDSLLAFTPEGQIAVLGWVFTPKEFDAEQVAFLWGEVHPEHRQRGLGSFILNWVETRCRQIMDSRPKKPPRYLRAFCPAHLHDRIALYEEYGFRVVRYFYRMRRNLSQPIPNGDLLPGIEWRFWNPEIDQAVLEVFNEAFRDHWGFIPYDTETWKLWETGHPSFRPDLTRLAMDGEKVVGICINRVNAEEIKVTGLKEGWIDDLAVLRPYRKRGIATVLICQAMRAFKDDGLDYAGLGVDTENTTGALRIYERLGFDVIKKSMSFSKEV